jgi:hypothetical protein
MHDLLAMRESKTARELVMNMAARRTFSIENSTTMPRGVPDSKTVRQPS